MITEEDILKIREKIPEPSRWSNPIILSIVDRQFEFNFFELNSNLEYEPIETIQFEKRLIYTKQGSSFWAWCIKDKVYI